ncbi:uncharacterized mitochondrial protein AtMg00810-like [Macadamia integrifolia]|uniref:uncharacterized mitochondrial protein AtMg00810-like n=1 Tax=Macadamia integrifolia TaxID=60698 RepID=UPI001C4E5CA8|nr:uncharacterized mitochondrial protein AtMg00810-like [Macadamia integrifolia]
MLGCNPADTPIQANGHLSSKKGDPVDNGKHQRLVGQLIYLSHTCPETTFPVSLVSQYMHDFYLTHMEVVMRILRSTTGYYTFIGGNFVIWRSEKQAVVTHSSAEAKFHAMAHGICELL